MLKKLLLASTFVLIPTSPSYSTSWIYDIDFLDITDYPIINYTVVNQTNSNILLDTGFDLLYLDAGETGSSFYVELPIDRDPYNFYSTIRWDDEEGVSHTCNAVNSLYYNTLLLVGTNSDNTKCEWDGHRYSSFFDF